MNIVEWTLKSECRCCKSENLRKILDLKDQPLANTYVSSPTKIKTYPLELMLCEDCFHLQLSVVVNPDLLFKNYLYVSGTSKTLEFYFEFFANFSINRYEKIFGFKPQNVLEVACNDGSQLNKYKAKGLETYGVDPAQNLHEISSKEHNVTCDYIGNLVTDKKFDLIVAQNVFAHTDDIDTFLNKLKEFSHDKSIIYIQTSQANMLLNNEFDTIYHEHLSFFNSYSMYKIVSSKNLYINNIFKNPIHGTSYIFEISKIKTEGNFTEEFFKEFNTGVFDLNFYTKYAKNCNHCVEELQKKINFYKEKKYKIVGYGAAAKGNTLLNFGKIDLDFIIDDNPLKHNLYTPGMNIPIKSIEKLKDYTVEDRICFIPLAWNFYNEIKQKIKNYRNLNLDTIIQYFPEIHEEII
jgi:2-polyprenyl-3-methyl-5-hydroxy-6-metoxy-1,4-benzoquinol methylase